jgi:DNA adenine methylase
LLDVPCKHFVDVFGGSGAVILNRQPSPIETYNDIDGGLVNFFDCLRRWPDRLIREISFTPYSREVYGVACRELRCKESIDYRECPKVKRIERARLYFVRARMTFLGKAQTATIGNWCNSHVLRKDNETIAGSVSRWHTSINQLSAIAERMLRVQIEHRDAIQVIQRSDSPETLLYCDPPYPHGQRKGKDRKAYSNEMSDDDHERLADALIACVGKVAVSFYANDSLLIERLYPRGKWTRHYGEKRISASTARNLKHEVQEMLLTNYEAGTKQ